MSFRVYYDSSDGVRIAALVREHVKAYTSIVMLHGINANKDEEGLFIKISKAMDNQKYNILRFDFRDHGDSTCPSGYMTIRGESDDLLSTLAYVQKRWRGMPVIIIAASFGAVPVLTIEYSGRF